MNEVHRLPYAVVRYQYDSVRDEAVNLGIIVQTPERLHFKLIEDWDSLLRAYPFMEKEVVERKMQSLASMLSREKFRVFDYQKNEPIELSATDPRLLSALGQEINHSIQLAAIRYAELPSVDETQLGTLVGYLFQTFVEPPLPQRVPRPEGAVVSARQTHGALHRAAKKTITHAARKAGLGSDFEAEASVTGQTRTWQFDLRLKRAPLFVHHILVLPDLEETYWETAGLARIWQDVKRKHRTADLAAVYFAKDGIQKDKLQAADRLLGADDIRTVYPDQLERLYREALGQRKLL